MKTTKLFTIAIISSAALFAFAETDPNLPAAEPVLAVAEQPAPFVPLDESGGIMFDFQDAPLTDVLDYLSEKAGFVIVSDAILSTRITIKSKQPVGEADIVTLLNTVLVDNGYTAIKVGRTLKIVDISSARHDNVPVSSGSNPDDLPDTDEVITHIIPIRYAEATKLQDDIESLVSDTADFTSNEASNSLIITDTALNIKRIMKVVKAVDTQMASIASVRVFHLVYAEADNTANIINEVFEQQATSSGNNDNPFSRFMRGGGPFGGDRGGRDSNNGDSQAGISQNVKVIASADDMTNTVVVSGPSDTLEIVADVVTQLDTNPDEDRTLFVYKLENADSDNIKDVLNNLFDAATSQDSNNNQDRRFGNFGQQSNASSSSSGEISDQVYIESDTDTNSLIIMTSEKNYKKIKPIIEELDMPVPQVLIKVLVAEVTVSNGFSLGAEFNLSNVDANGDNRVYSTELLDNTGVTLDGANFSILQGDLNFTLNALSTSGKVNVLSRPYVLTSNNQAATINVGKEVPFITDSNVSEGVITNSVDYQNIGISLEVTPKINSNGLVTMDIAPEVSTISEDETVKISDNFNATIFTTRSCSGRVAVKDGQTIVVGGLMEDDDSEIVKKVPLLGDIPLLGALFSSTEKSKEKKELLIFLTPIVAQRENELVNITEHESSMSESMQGIETNPALKSQMKNMKSVPQK